MVERAHPLQPQATNAAQCAAANLAPVAPLTRAVVRAGGAAVIAVGDKLGVALPAVPFRSSEYRGRVALWLGPDEWLVLAGGGTEWPMMHPGASIVDVSHAMTGLTVSGNRAAWSINAFCALDLHPSAFPVGMCTRTVFAKAQIVLWRTAADTFRIEVARSFAPYVWDCLEEARREFLAADEQEGSPQRHRER
jgi:heterotetrameric sarcosine oxidase gamma subunit